MSEPGAMPLAAALIALLILSPARALPQGGPHPPVAPLSVADPGTHADTPDTSLRDSARAAVVSPARGKKGAWTAVGLSAVLPGAGQVYTENYWKVPIILGLGGYWVYEWGRNDDRYEEYRDLYDRSVETNPPGGNQQYLALREAYRDQRDAFAWYLGILYLANLVDAYVGAELYDFDVGPELGAGGRGARATIRIHL